MNKRARVAIILILVVIVCAILLASCDNHTDENGDTIYDCGTSHFIFVEKCGEMRIIVHKETGVMYLVCKDYGGWGGATVIVDSDGKPLIWEAYKQDVQDGKDND